MARTRRRAWALTIAAAMLAVVWVGSMRWSVSVSWPPRYRLATNSGQITIYREGRAVHDDGFAIEAWDDGDWYLEWWFGYDLMSFNGGPAISIWHFPLWPFILLTGIPGVWMLAKSRRAKGVGANLCPTCSYDLTGLPATSHGPTVCPECGKD